MVRPRKAFASNFFLCAAGLDSDPSNSFQVSKLDSTVVN